MTAWRNTLVAGGLVVMACLLPPRGQAQGVARQIASVRDGTVRMSFAARPEICGFGNGISSRSNRDESHTWSSRTTEDVLYDNECSEGPARVVVTLRGGNVERVRAYVGGRWRPDASARDLGTVSARDAVSYLLGVANTQSGKGAGEAIFATTLADSVELAQPLYSIATNQSRPREVRDHAIFWMSQLDDDRVIGMFQDLLRTSREDYIIDKTIFALSQHRSGKGFPILRSYAENENASSRMREKAIFWLGQKHDDGGDYLRNLYTRVRDEDLREKIIFSVSQQRDDASMKWLVDLASNSSEPMELRKKALFWAGQSGTSVNSLVSMYDRMREHEMKEQMIFVFSQRREPAATDKLMAIAKNDPDRTLRRKAMFWLGQSRDARVATFLADMINR